MAIPGAGIPGKLYPAAHGSATVPRGHSARLRNVFEGDPPSSGIVEDPALIAEFLLLLRMVLADGPISARESATLGRIAREVFGMDENEVGPLLGQLEAFGRAPSTAQTIAAFRAMARDRRRLLAHALVRLATADEELGPYQTRLIARATDMLGLTHQEVTRPKAAG